jgi:RecB family exonuclease
VIDRAELLRLADELGLEPRVIEKDYVLGWVLTGIFRDPLLANSWVFKGGTCLKKCYFETYRFSGDLDFTVRDPAQLEEDFLRQRFTELSAWLYNETGIELPVELLRFEVWNNERGGRAGEGRISYRGPIAPRGGDLPRIKLDLTADETVVGKGRDRLTVSGAFRKRYLLYTQPMSEWARGRGKGKLMRVMFDSNTLDRAARPERFPKDPRQVEYIRVHDALAAGTLKGYFSETLVTLEAIENKDRIDVLGSTRIDSETRATGENTISISLSVKQDRKPLPPEFSRRIQAAQKLGMRAVRGPARMGWVRVRDDDDTFFEPEPNVLGLAARLDKASEVADAIQVRGRGNATAVRLGLKFSERDGKVGEWWFQALRRAQDESERRKVQRAIREWADADSIAAHVGYGIDLFCSEDMGKSTGGEPSVLDAPNRAWLTATFGIKFVTLAELAAMERIGI